MGTTRGRRLPTIKQKKEGDLRTAGLREAEDHGPTNKKKAGGKRGRIGHHESRPGQACVDQGGGGEPR